MRIGISGAQGVGKTTLINRLHLADHEIKTEIVRSLNLPINKKGTFESQLQIMTAHGLVVQDKNILSDRSIVDSFVYGLWSYLNGHFTKEQFDVMEAYFKAILPWYDVHVYIPPQFPLQEDGVRDTDGIYQQEIHRLFKRVFHKYGIVTTWLTGSIEERVHSFGREMSRRYSL